MTTTDIAETPQILQPSPGFFIRQAVDNMAWMDMGDYVLVVDALEQAELEQEVMDAIKRTAGPAPVRFVLNTHTHNDHVALNDAFRRRFQAEIVNRTVSRIRDQGRWFQGRRRVQMLPMGGCHTEEDCVVWCPDDRVLLVGDIFGWGLIPLVGRLDRASRKLLESTYRRLIEFDARIVVPGHGPVCTTAELVRWVKYLGELIDSVSAACRAGRSDQEILDQTAPPADMHGWWRFLKWKHQDSVQKVFHSVRRGLLP